jgi:hypothetical protein
MYFYLFLKMCVCDEDTVFCRKNNIYGKPGLTNTKKLGATPRQAAILYNNKFYVRNAVLTQMKPYIHAA